MPLVVTILAFLEVAEEAVKVGAMVASGGEFCTDTCCIGMQG